MYTDRQLPTNGKKVTVQDYYQVWKKLPIHEIYKRYLRLNGEKVGRFARFDFEYHPELGLIATIYSVNGNPPRIETCPVNQDLLVELNRRETGKMPYNTDLVKRIVELSKPKKPKKR